MNKIVDERESVYGEPVQQFTRIAHMWSSILDHEIQPWQVPLMMVGLKLIRTADTPDYSDNSNDIEGYLEIFRRILGEDMVEATTTAEYRLMKQAMADG